MISRVLWLVIPMKLWFLIVLFAVLLPLEGSIVNFTNYHLFYISEYWLPIYLRFPYVSLRHIQSICLSWGFGFCLFSVLYICWKIVCDGQTRNASPFRNMHGSVFHASDEKHNRMHDLLGSLPSSTLAASMHLLPMPNRRKKPKPNRRRMPWEITIVIRRIWLKAWQQCNLCSYFCWVGL